MKRSDVIWRQTLPLLALAALGAYDLGRAPLTAAEQSYIEAARAPAAELLRVLYSPFYLLYLHAWSALGQSAAWLRLSSLACGLLALFLAARVVRGLGGAHAERGALILLGLSPFLVGQVRSLSPAPLALLATVVCFLCFLEFLRAGQWQWLLGWSVAALAALTLHAGLYYAVLIQCLGLVFYRERFHNKQRDWWLAQILPLAFFIWRFGEVALHYFRVRLVAALPSGRALLEEGASIFSRLLLDVAPSSSLGLAGGALFLLLLGPGLWSCRDLKRDPRHGLLLLGFFAPALLFLLTPRSVSYLLAGLPCLLTLVSMGLRSYAQWGRQILWSGIAVCLAFAYYHFF